MGWSVVGRWQVGGEWHLRSLVYARGLKTERARVLHKILLVPVLTYGSETLLWKEKERSRIRAVQMVLGGWIESWIREWRRE